MTDRFNLGQVLGGQRNSANTEVIKTVGMVAGIQTDKVIDNKDHFPISSENAARSAISRVTQLTETPDWFMGTIAELATLVGDGITKRYPKLDISVAVRFDRVLAAVIKNPYAGLPTKVPSVPVPFLKSKAEMVEYILANPNVLSADAAKSLPEKIEDKIGKLNVAKELANTLISTGLSGEQFALLMDYLQEEILYELLYQQSQASDKTDELINNLKNSNKG